VREVGVLRLSKPQQVVGMISLSWSPFCGGVLERDGGCVREGAAACRMPAEVRRVEPSRWLSPSNSR
jgi:hypothetical protein